MPMPRQRSNRHRATSHFTNANAARTTTKAFRHGSRTLPACFLMPQLPKSRVPSAKQLVGDIAIKQTTLLQIPRRNTPNISEAVGGVFG